MNTNVDLGHLLLCCPKMALDLSLSGFALLSHPAEESAASHATDPITSDSVWFSRGLRVELVLDVTVNLKEIDIDLLRQVENRLVATLRDFSIWPQLHFIPSLTMIPSIRPNCLHRVVVTLCNETSDDNIVRSSLHRLGADVPIFHVKPPEGIATFGVDQVHLALEIYPSGEMPARYMYTSGLDGDHDLAIPVRNEKVLGRKTQPDVSNDVLNKGKALSLQSRNDYEGLERSHLAEHETTDQGVYHHTITSSTGLVERTSLAASIKQSTSSASLVIDIVDFLGAALRLAIAGVPRKLLPGITVREIASFKHLSAIFPAIWSPGFLTAIASRAVFLSTVSHALSHISQCNVKSDSLRAKINATAQQENAIAFGLNTNQTSTLNISRAAISRQLWRLMQSSLLDKEVGKKITFLTHNPSNSPEATTSAISTITSACRTAKSTRSMPPEADPPRRPNEFPIRSHGPAKPSESNHNDGEDILFHESEKKPYTNDGIGSEVGLRDDSPWCDGYEVDINDAYESDVSLLE